MHCSPTPRMQDERAAPVMAEQHEVVVIGGGQAGLALGYELALRQVTFVILDQSPRVGHSWRTRWDSLTLFTPHPYNDLPGLRFPGMPGRYPTKDGAADYLEQYAATFELPVRLNCRVTALRGCHPAISSRRPLPASWPTRSWSRQAPSSCQSDRPGATICRRTSSRSTPASTAMPSNYLPATC